MIECVIRFQVFDRFGDTWDITAFERCELHLDVKAEPNESNESKESKETKETKETDSMETMLKESLTSHRGLVSRPVCRSVEKRFLPLGMTGRK